MAVLTVIGCSGPASDPSGDPAAMLSIDPPSSELWIRNGVPAVTSVTATLTDSQGDAQDVTNEVAFSIDAGFGAFAGSQLTLRSAGKTQVIAMLGDHMAQAEVIGRVDQTRVDPSLPAGAIDWFANAVEQPSRAPTVVYPPPNIVMPRNLGIVEAHWTDAQNNVFELSLTTEYATVRVIAPGTAGTIANSKWLALLASEWSAAVANAPTVELHVRGLDRANPTVVGSAPPRRIWLSHEEMLGGLYYWAATAANGPFGIFRHDMSKPGEPVEQYMTTAQTSGRCVACHVLSRDGKTMAITYDGGNGASTFVDVGTKQTRASARGWNFGAFTPDGGKFLAVQHGQLTVINPANQATLATMTSSGYVSQPDLSASGGQLVYVRSTGTSEDYLVTGGTLIVRTFNATTNAFGPERVLVADTSNNFYPSFSPDGAWVLYSRAASGSSYNNPNATLWVTKTDGTGTPIQLVKANATASLANSWARWAPFAQTIEGSGEPVYWVTFSSRRNFGVRLVGANRPQIWMTPFFPKRAATSADPSAPAFWLPFQNLSSNNHIAQWTEQVVVLL